MKLKLTSELAASTFPLYFKASAWNANAASISTLVKTDRNSETEVEEVDVIKPYNSLLNDAKVIEGAEGTEELDLMGSLVESGEPRIRSYSNIPAGSVSLRWTSPSSGMV